MNQPRTDWRKFAPPQGVLPVLQYALPAQLKIDPDYQRSIENGPSQRLISKIAQGWNWALCLPLVVARRETGDLYVIDGQHRLEAAKLRGDIAQLPCVIVEMPHKLAEAANFVELNQRRRPLSKLDIFKASVASGDAQSSAIVRAVTEVGLSVAPHMNIDSWKPGMIGNIGGIEATWRKHGAARTRATLHIFAAAFGDQVIRYGGTIFPGIVDLVVRLTEKRDPLIWMKGEDATMLAEMLSETPQAEWRRDIFKANGDDPELKLAGAAAKVIADAWAELIAAFDGADEEQAA